MDFLLVFGGILLLIALCVKPHLEWRVDPKSCNIEQDKKNIRTNKIAWWSILSAGITMMIVALCFILF